MTDGVKSVLGHNLSTDEARMDHLRKAIDNQIKQFDKEIAEQKKQVAEYEQLRSRIEELPRKLTREILVPFGSVGYMKGRIMQTNKVMVSLGDNYFVERSCYEASQVIDRRIAYIKKIIEGFESQKKMIISKAEFSDKLFKSGGNEFEIREPYDEQKELELMLKRRKRKNVTTPRRPTPENSLEATVASVSDSNDRTKLVTEQENEKSDLKSAELLCSEEAANIGAAPKGVDDKEFLALMEKLDRMEREENERNELEETSSDDESALDSDDLPEWDVDSSGGPRVRASASGVAIEKDKATKETAVAAMEDDHGPCCSSEPLMDSVSPPLRIDAIAERTACEGRRARRSQRSVRFRSEVECTPSVDEVRGDSVADEGLKAGANENAKNAPTQEEVPEDEPKTIINDEPRFSTALPRRSILRNSAERSPIDAKAVAEADCRDRPLIAPSSEQVFTGVICERLNPEVPSSSTSTHVVPGASAAQQRNSQSSAEPSKRVSRFKMYRAQLDRPNR